MKTKFKPGDLIQNGSSLDIVPKRARIISIENDFYKIFWIDTKMDADQFKLFRADVIDAFYEKKV